MVGAWLTVATVFVFQMILIGRPERRGSIGLSAPAALTALAHQPVDLQRRDSRHYEQFRLRVPAGESGWVR